MYLRATHTRIPLIIYVAMAFHGNTKYIILNGMGTWHQMYRFWLMLIC